MTLRRIILVALVLALSGEPARAHRVGADAFVLDDGRTIQVEAWYYGGKAPKTGSVTVLNPDGTEFVRGTMQNGVFTFEAARAVPYRINVQLGEGHAKEFTLADDVVAEISIDEGATDARESPGVAASAATSVPAEREAGHGGGAAEAGRRAPARRVVYHEDAADWKMGVVLGLTAIAAVTAVAMAAVNRKRLRRIEARLALGDEVDDDAAPD
jgi:hypothetical protein